VQRHQRDDTAVGARRVRRDLVGVGHERHPLEEVLQRDDLAGLDPLLVELARHLDQLGEVLDPGLVLGVGAGPQLAQVPALLDDRLEQPGDAGPVAQTLDSDSSSPVNTSIAATDRVAMPGASADGPSAATKGMRSRSASWAMQASARSPIPRLGTLMIRRRLTVSAGFEITRSRPARP
jgi:hypothetical protein